MRQHIHSFEGSSHNNMYREKEIQNLYIFFEIFVDTSPINNYNSRDFFI